MRYRSKFIFCVWISNFSYTISFFLLNYILLFMLLQLFQFSPLWLLYPGHPPLPQAMPTPWVMHICSLATLFPMLYFTFPQLFCNYKFVLLNLLTLFTHALTPLQCGSHHNVLCIYDSVSVLLAHLLWVFLDSIVDGYVFIVILLFIFLIFSLKTL